MGDIIITKCGSYFVTKYEEILFQNPSDFSLKNATFLLQNALILFQNATVTTKCDIYFNM